jgi:hypothetical protein
MLYEDLYSQFIDSYNEGDNNTASLALMRELGNILVTKREDFVYLLNESDIPATADMSDAELVNLFVDNIGTNPKLTLGASLLANMENADTNFDGEKRIDDDAVKAGYSCMMCYFNGEDYSNAIDPVTAIAQGVGELSKLGTTISSGQQKKKYGAMDTAAQKQQARSEIVKQVIAQRQAQIEAAQKEKETQQKTTRTLLIVGGVVVGLTILGVAVYMMRKRGK